MGNQDTSPIRAKLTTGSAQSKPSKPQIGSAFRSKNSCSDQPIQIGCDLPSEYKSDEGKSYIDFFMKVYNTKSGNDESINANGKLLNYVVTDIFNKVLFPDHSEHTFNNNYPIAELQGKSIIEVAKGLIIFLDAKSLEMPSILKPIFLSQLDEIKNRKLSLFADFQLDTFINLLQSTDHQSDSKNVVEKEKILDEYRRLQIDTQIYNSIDQEERQSQKILTVNGFNQRYQELNSAQNHPVSVKPQPASSKKVSAPTADSIMNAILDSQTQPETPEALSALREKNIRVRQQCPAYVQASLAFIKEVGKGDLPEQNGPRFIAEIEQAGILDSFDFIYLLDTAQRLGNDPAYLTQFKQILQLDYFNLFADQNKKLIELIDAIIDNTITQVDFSKIREQFKKHLFSDPNHPVLDAIKKTELAGMDKRKSDVVRINRDPKNKVFHTTLFDEAGHSYQLISDINHLLGKRKKSFDPKKRSVAKILRELGLDQILELRRDRSSKQMRLIGKGEFSKIKLVWSEAHQCFGVVKKVSVENEDHKTEVLEEARLQASLSESNGAMPIWGFVLSKGKNGSEAVYIFMPFAVSDGKKACAQIKSESQKKQLAKAALTALSRLHQAGVVHNDFWIDNLFQPRPKKEGAAQWVVGDFGHARRLDEHGLFLPSDKKIPWERVAPESVLGAKNKTMVNGQKADAWQAGMLLYHLFFSDAGVYQNPFMDVFEVYRSLISDPQLEDLFKDQYFDAIRENPNMKQGKVSYSEKAGELEDNGTIQAVIMALLAIKPERRITIEQALDMKFFQKGRVAK